MWFLFLSSSMSAFTSCFYLYTYHYLQPCITNWDFQKSHNEGFILQARPYSTSCLCGVHPSTNRLRPPADPSGGSNDMPSIQGNTCRLTSGELCASDLTCHSDCFPLKRFFPLQLPLNYQLCRHWLTTGSSRLVQYMEKKFTWYITGDVTKISMPSCVISYQNLGSSMSLIINSTWI